MAHRHPYRWGLIQAPDGWQPQSHGSLLPSCKGKVVLGALGTTALVFSHSPLPSPLKHRLFLGSISLPATGRWELDIWIWALGWHSSPPQVSCTFCCPCPSSVPLCFGSGCSCSCLLAAEYGSFCHARAPSLGAKKKKKQLCMCRAVRCTMKLARQQCWLAQPRCGLCCLVWR